MLSPGLGPGGVGKTRLADEVLRQVAGRFADGVWVAELAAVADPAFVPAMDPPSPKTLMYRVSGPRRRR